MIFHQHAAIFFHVGKTAGTAIEDMILPGKRDPYTANRRDMFGYDKQLKIYLQHATCQTMLNLVSEEIFRSYFKFTIVRNPFTRLLSAYYSLYEYNLERYGRFRDYILSIPDLVAGPSNQSGSHEISQAYYTHLHGEQVSDYVGKFEQLEEAVAYIKQRLGIRTNLPAVNVSGHPEYVAIDERATYDDEMIEIMNEIYRDDFALYGYSIEPPARDLDRNAIK